MSQGLLGGGRVRGAGSRRGAATTHLGCPERLESRIALSVSPPTVILPPALDGDLGDLLRPAAISSDPGVASQWSLGTVSATRAWDITTGSRNVVVAVIDSGIDLTHPDLVANLWTNPGEVAGNGIDDDRNGFVDDIHGWNFAANTNNLQDGYGHGTHVAGIIGASGNNGVGVTGLNWTVSIMTLRFQDDRGVGYTGDAIKAVQYATMMRRDFGVNVVVINASWGGGTGYSSLLETAIRDAGSAGITFVAAAGNSGANNDVATRYPSGYDLPNVIAVGACDSTGTLAGFSDYGATSVDLAAPGTSIYSTLPRGQYGWMAGTSQATPHVSATVALLAAAKPGLSVAEVRSAILGSVDRLPALTGRVATGGRLNAFAALASLGVPPGATTAPAPVTTAPVTVAPATPAPAATASVTPAPAPAVGRLELARLTRVRGWAFSPQAGAAPVSVRLEINGITIGTYVANVRRLALRRAFGSVNHGFSIAVNRRMFHRGLNEVRVEAIDPTTGMATLIGTRTVRW
jgi:subtilisin family serine protease